MAWEDLEPSESYELLYDAFSNFGSLYCYCMEKSSSETPQNTLLSVAKKKKHN